MSGLGTYLGFDLGTSGLRGLLMDVAGGVIGVDETSFEVARPHLGWSEQEPSDWIKAVTKVVFALRSAHPDDFARLSGIGVSGHMHGATLIDNDGEVLRPCILWNDTRCHEEAAALDAQPEVRRLSGNVVFPGFTAPKLVWVARHEPEIFRRVSRVVLPATYLNFWLSGNCIGDMSDAAGTSWLDVGRRAWSDRLLTAGGMRSGQMPDVVEGSQSIGTLRADLAVEWGVSKNVTIAGGGGDNAVAACGVGALNEGDGFVSLGTSGALVIARERFAPMPETAVHTFCHAVPERWYQMGVILAATDCLNWLSELTGRTPSELTGDLSTKISGAGEIQFLPYLSGERTPHNDAGIRGGFLNIDVADGLKQMTRAVLEGVSFALRDNLEALKATGARPKRLLAIGGGTASQFWLELLATILNLPLDLPAQGEFGAALGAARLGLCADTGANPQTIMTNPKIARSVQPRADLIENYDAAWRRWRRLYPALKELT
ncbi:xylulokinase [Ruegeria sp. SCPT10]|uniref:xylulokinase n=1 Tax=Ruegeria sp. SCP10 TaxID=3141377 RepID=UPI003335ACFA